MTLPRIVINPAVIELPPTLTIHIIVDLDGNASPHSSLDFVAPVRGTSHATRAFPKRSGGN